MKYGVYLPNFGDEISALVLAELAGEAEQSGWDGFFLWDHMLANKNQKLNIVDPWIALTAMAMRTTRIRLGTTVTPLARRRPWHLARETVTLDHLSKGRLLLGVGIGEPPDADFAFFGEESDAKIRAEKLDESLDILAGLWSGRSFAYEGKHYHISKVTFQPASFQKPRIPVWVGGFWPNKAPFRRAARWDGVLPLKMSAGFFLGPEDLNELLGFIRKERRIEAAFDAVIIGTRSGLGKKPLAAKKSLEKLAQAGATWWLQALYLDRNSAERLRLSIRQGPPV